MALKSEFVEYIAEQCLGAGKITYRMMFGAYGLYCDGKFLAIVNDGECFVKITELGLREFPNLPKKPPYDGAKDYFFVEDTDNAEIMTRLVKITADALPEPKPKKPKPKKP